jgi:excisionase family DNA binding protein
MGEEILTRDEVAKRLSLHQNTISIYIRDRKFPHHRIGPKALRFVWSEVLAWVKENGGDHGRSAA